MNQSPTTSDQISKLEYARPKARQSFYSVVAMMMAVLSLATVAYVQIEAAIVQHRLGLPPYWELLDNFAWVPGAMGLLLAICGLVQIKRKQGLSIIAIAVIAVSYCWWLKPILFR